MTKEVSIEEKIDFIYERLKKEEGREKRALFFKWGVRLFIGLLAGYLYFFGINLIVDKTLSGVKTIVTENALNIKNSAGELYDSFKNKLPSNFDF